MQKRTRSTIQILAAAGMLIGWLAVILQYILLIKNNRDLSLAEASIRFFTFFTILTNILVAISFSYMYFQNSSLTGFFFRNPKTTAAITLYILIVGMTYNIILRNQWHPKGLQKIVDEALHSFIPVYYFFCWLFFMPKNKMKWKDIWPWMIFPLVYMVIVMIRGAATGYYPYPFLMVTKLHYPRVLLNCLFIALAFLIVGLALIWFCRWSPKAFETSKNIK